jgi:XapX domain-containing protein
MKIYALSLGAGLLVGILYALINVRSPAPPIIALIGLLGILAGEQIPSLVKRVFDKQPVASSWHEQVKPHMFGHLPSAPGAKPEQLADAPLWMQSNGDATPPTSEIPTRTDGKPATPPAPDPNA